jgi:hypothetical protein
MIELSAPFAVGFMFGFLTCLAAFALAAITRP